MDKLVGVRVPTEIGGVVGVGLTLELGNEGERVFVVVGLL